MTPTATQLEEQRVALTGHCYRMLGSAAEADDAVQETVLRAWRSLERFDGRASLRTWLYRIATNVCLDALADRSRRARPMELGPEGSADDPLNELPRTHWLEPIPDSKALPADADPSELLVLRQSIRLAPFDPSIGRLSRLGVVDHRLVEVGCDITCALGQSWRQDAGNNPAACGGFQNGA